MVDETGYTLYEYSDPPLIGYDNLNSLPYGHDHWASKIPPSTHGFARKVNMKSKGSWWGWDIHDVYSRADSTWNPTEHPSAEVLPEECTMVDICHPYCWDRSLRHWSQRWAKHHPCRIGGTVEECGKCETKDGTVMRSSNPNAGWCKCKKKWDEIKGIPMVVINSEATSGKYSKEWERVWTGFTTADFVCPGDSYIRGQCWWRQKPWTKTPYWIMDLTYYRLGDHVFTEAEVKALYMKGRSVEPLNENHVNELPSNRH